MNAPDRAALRLTQFSHGGGCGCKIAPGLLAEILARAPQGIVPPELLVGTETSDDAAVYRLNATQALVSVSRAQREARIYTDSVELFEEAVTLETGHPEAASDFLDAAEKARRILMEAFM